jgi:hypothetical protein
MEQKDIIHFTPFRDSFNVRCLNGSAHARRTEHMEFVTCLLCLNKNTNKEFWDRHEMKHGNVHKVSNKY